MPSDLNNNIAQRIQTIRHTLNEGVTLVCVSKFHPAESILEAYNAGERDFGESRVQELVAKHETLPKDIRWHMIGHLQTNKVRAIVPFVHLIQSVDSIHLLETINREAQRINRVVNVLLEVHVARETTKSGFSPEELSQISNLKSQISNIHICGLMGMATNTEDEQEIRRCFGAIRSLAEQSGISNPIISMGMSDDYLIAQQEGSTLVRIGTTIFGSRQY